MARRVFMSIVLGTNCVVVVVVIVCVYIVLISQQHSTVTRIWDVNTANQLIAEEHPTFTRKTTVKSSSQTSDEGVLFASQPLCPKKPPSLHGRVPVVLTPVSVSQLEANHTELLPGGAWRPAGCRARHHVAIIIPYRNRENDLQQLLRHIHPILQRQQLDYAIYVVELALPTTFNRAMLMNIGFVESSKLSNYSCHIFHDVDLLPEDDRAIYGCSKFPKHMSSSLSRHDYRLLYTHLIGGATAIKPEHFRQINGFSNMYFGWGGEDDDLYQRLVAEKLPVIRNPKKIARYYSRRNKRDKLNKKNPHRHKLLKNAKERMKTDGLNNLYYERIFIKKMPLYTWLYVNIHK